MDHEGKTGHLGVPANDHCNPFNVMRLADRTTAGGAKGHWTGVSCQRPRVPLGRKSHHG